MCTTLRTLAALLAIALLATVLIACDSTAEPDAQTPAPNEQAQDPEPAPQPAEPTYRSWVVNIADQDSNSEGPVTFTISLNLSATNPSADKAGTYTGEAVAHSETSGEVNGQHLQGDAIAQSGTLTFTLDDPTGDGALAPLTEGDMVYTGTGTISMKASGSASLGQASGGIKAESTDPVKVRVEGDKVTLKVNLAGGEYTFSGTIAGQE